MEEKNTITFLANRLLNYEAVKPRIRSSLINSSNLKEKQAKAPVCADVWKTWFIELPSSKDEKTVVYIGNDLLVKWGKTVDDIDAAARENEQGTSTIMNMGELLGVSRVLFEMYIATNLEGWNGATAILNSTVQKQLDELFPDGYAVLPSSVHEVIALPVDAAVNSCEIVKYINRTDLVKEKEFLSDHVFQVKDGHFSVLV